LRPWVVRYWTGQVSLRYSIPDSVSTYSSNQDSLCREHVYRCHSRPKYSCPRCFQTCESQADLNAHSRSEPPCRVLNRDLIPPDGIDEDQRVKIKSRKYNRTDGDSNPLDVSERWKHMYMVCFPDVAAEKVPSPRKLQMSSHRVIDTRSGANHPLPRKDYHDENAGASVHPTDGFAAFLHQDISASIRQQIQDEVERDPYLCRSGSDRLVNFIVKLTPRLIRSILTIYQESAQEQEYPDSTTTTARNDEPSTGITTYSSASIGPTDGFTISPAFTYPDPPSHAAIPSNSGHNSNPSRDNPRDDSQLLFSSSTDPNMDTDLRHLHLLDGDLLRDLAWIDTDKYRF